MQNLGTLTSLALLMTCSGLFGNSRLTHFNASAAKCEACFSVNDLLVFIWELAAKVGNSRMSYVNSESFHRFDSVTVRWSADVYVWTSGGARNRRAKRQIRNSVLLQKVQQRLAFDAVRMKLDIHRVVMVQPPAIMNCSLPEDRDRKLLVEGVRKESLDLPRLAEVPATGAR